MRDHECLDANIANFKTAARRKKPAVHAELQLMLDGVPGCAIAINRKPQFFAKSRQTLDMIRVFVRDENATEVFGCASDRCQSLSDLPGAEPRID
jgi:hypothetical protein